MTTAEKLYQVTQKLTQPALEELLDFAEFLSQRQKLTKTSRDDTLPSRPSAHIKGGLENSSTFSKEALAIQQTIRDEWH